MSRRVAAILLAAGKSSRMGSCKQLLPLGECSVIARCLKTLRSGGVNDIVVVVSEDGQEVAMAAESFGVRVVVNREHDGDMASSIRAGRDALDDGLSGVIVALCDYPLVTPATVEYLIGTHAMFPDGIITPRHQDSRGHPLLFARVILNELGEGMTLRGVMRRDPARVFDVAVDDPGILIDMDTPEDYIRVRTLLNQHRTL